jgi:hypothetical protein
MSSKSECATLSVKVIPNASRTEVVGWLGEDLKIRLQAVPENGKANKALIKFLAGQLKCQRKQIILESGEFSPQKRLRIEGVERAQLISLLGITENHV